MTKTRFIFILSILILSILVAFGLIFMEDKQPPPLHKAISQTQKRETAPTKPTKTLPPTASLLMEPVDLRRFELPTEAITVWREFKAYKPALLVLSNNPFLTQLPELMRPKATTLLQSATRQEIQVQSNPQMAAPLLFPEMAVDAVMRDKMIGQYIWAIPMKDGQAPLTTESFRARLLDHRLITPHEAEALEVDEHGVAHGSLRDLPFTAGDLETLPKPDSPVIVHIDLSYFQTQYVNEMKTPVFQLVQDAMQRLQKMECQVLAVTFSYGNLDGRIALDVRFMGDALTDIMKSPDIIYDDLLGNYKRQADALYLEAMFRKEQAQGLYLAQERDLPKSAWVQHNLFRSAASHKQGNLALERLAKAVELDKVFAMAYFDLSDQALRARQPAEALRMLKLASDTFPDNPTIKLKMAELAYTLMDFKTAEHLIKQLQSLPWSEIYHPDMHNKLDRFIQMAKEAQELNSKSDR